MQAINKERVAGLLQGLAQFGKTEHGITRLAYTAEDKAAQEWLLKQIQDLQLKLSVDAGGNVFLRREGKNTDLAPVAMGSHIDTVVQGGAYDGTVGVVGALEVLYMLQDEELERPIEVIIFRAEESSRFGFATIGSKLMAGVGDPDKFSGAAKEGAVTFKEALTEWGCDPAAYKQARKAAGCFKSFWEIHIEQGKVLEETGERIGIVHNIAAPTRFKIIVEGIADHSGATPMGFRKDALVSAARLVIAIEEAATNEAESGTVATVGVLDVEPSSINVVPGKATLWVDLRGVDEESINCALSDIRDAVSEIAKNDSITITMDMLTADNPVALSEELAAKLDVICAAKGIAYRHMNSGAGHDAMHMAKLAPASMLFVPCKGGISHNPAEYADNEDICLAIEILAEAVKEEASA